LILFFIAQQGYSQLLFETLKADYENGQLNYEEYLVFSALNIFDPGKLPQTYQVTLADELPIKTGTFIIQEVKANWDKLSPESQNLLKSYLSRPELPFSILSPGKKFRIHYATSGSHQVSPEDNNTNNLPDYVEKAAECFDKGHNIMVNQLGFQSPASDSNGVGKEFDIYLVALNRTYGITWLESGVPGKAGAYSCYIEVDNDFVGFPTEPLGALQVTSAHEYFHAVQVSYRYREDDVFFMEMCSTWMEDYAYPAVNDYLLYLKNFFANINYPFYYTNGSWFEYGSCVWIHMIVKKFNPEVMRKVWNLIPKQTAFTAIQDVLQQYGTTFNEELAAFGLWNYFTGSRADTVQFYSEGHLYPEVSLAGDYFLQYKTLSLNEQMRKLSSTYFKVTNENDQKEIGLVITNFDTPSKNYLTNDKADIKISLVPLQAGDDSDDFDFFLKNNLVKLNGNVGIRMDVPDSLASSFRAMAVISGDNQADIVQFFPPPSITKNAVSIYNIYPNPFMIGQQDSLTIKYVVSEPEPGEIMFLTENGLVVKQASFQSPLYKYNWDGRNSSGDFVSSGIYLVLLRAGSSVDVKKVAIIRK
jgi:hypothetical protein